MHWAGEARWFREAFSSEEVILKGMKGFIRWTRWRVNAARLSTISDVLPSSSFPLSWCWPALIISWTSTAADYWVGFLPRPYSISNPDNPFSLWLKTFTDLNHQRIKLKQLRTIHKAFRGLASTWLFKLLPTPWSSLRGHILAGPCMCSWSCNLTTNGISMIGITKHPNTCTQVRSLPWFPSASTRLFPTALG